MRERVLKCIYSAIDSLGSKRYLKKDEESPLIGGLGPLDSMGLVELIVSVEQEIEKEFNKSLVLADEKISKETVYPFKTIKTLANYISSLLKKDKETSYKKVVIVDLDNTLWEGIAGDDGLDVKIYGQYLDLQKRLKELSKRGILLAICSKNTPDIAIEIIDKHPGMILRSDDFILKRINWDPKSDNIYSIMSELNLIMDSAVFIDDDIHERDLVEHSCPGISVSDKLETTFFSSGKLTPEDWLRVQMYKTEKDRKQSLDQFQSLDEWLNNLGTVVSYKEVDQNNIDRTVQLLNKTNQMNLSTRRLSKEELRDWLSSPSNYMRVVYSRDKFGDSGLIGVVSLSEDSWDSVSIVDFVLSCRVMNRMIEEAMLYIAINLAKELKVRAVYAVYKPTEKNSPCLEFFKRSVMKTDKAIFRYYCRNEVIPPRSIKIEEAK
jgi:FkbH-like protein